MGKIFKDMAGQKFGRLTAIERSDNRGKNGKKTYWRCVCDCGCLCEIEQGALHTGKTRSCGCLKAEWSAKPKKIVHGMSRTPEHRAFINAKYRCTNPNVQRWEDYGGRGIKFLFTSFAQFYAELGPRPEGKTLDRINNDGNYEPGNVRWATKAEQSANQRPVTAKAIEARAKALRGKPWSAARRAAEEQRRAA
jgi:hypothetical protein